MPAFSGSRCLLLLALGAWPATLGRGAGAQPAAEPQYQYLAPGIARFSLHDPQSLWHAQGLAVDLTDPLVNIDVAVARPSVLGRETIGQVALRHEETRRRLVALVGCDFPEEEGLPRGLAVNRGELLSVPGGNSSFLVTRSGKQALGRLHWAMEFECYGGARIPVHCVNRRPDPGENALFSPHFGLRTGTSEGTTDLELELFDSYLNPTGETLVKVGRVYPGHGNQVIPRLGFILSLPNGLYERHAPQLGYGMRAKIRTEIRGDDVPDEIRSELAPGGESPEWPSRIGWAVSGGPRILRSGKTSLEAAKEGISPDAVGLGNSQTALGIDPSRDRLWVAVVRAAGAHRVGMLEAARCLVLLGATDGMLLAGGDRSPLRIQEEVVNPAVSSRLEVPIASALLVYSKSLEPGLGALAVAPAGIVYVPVGGAIDFQVAAYDWTGREVQLRPNDVQLEMTDDIGTLEGTGFLAGGREGSADIVFRVAGTFGGSFADITRRVTVSVRRPDRLAVIPNPVFLNPGDRADLRAELQDREGNLLAYAAEEVEWRLRDLEGAVSPQGVLIAAATGIGTVEARYRRWRGESVVYTGVLRTVELDPMQAPGEWETGIDQTMGAESEFRPLQGTIAGGHAAVLQYSFPELDGACVIIGRRLPVGGRPYGFRTRIYGDGSGHRLRCLVEDRLGRRFHVGFREPVAWSGSWRELDAPLDLAVPADRDSGWRLRFPVTFAGLAVVRGTNAASLEGGIGIGPLEALYVDTR